MLFDLKKIAKITYNFIGFKPKVQKYHLTMFRQMANPLNCSSQTIQNIFKYSALKNIIREPIKQLIVFIFTLMSLI